MIYPLNYYTYPLFFLILFVPVWKGPKVFAQADNIETLSAGTAMVIPSWIMDEYKANSYLYGRPFNYPEKNEDQRPVIHDWIEYAKKDIECSNAEKINNNISETAKNI